MISIIVPVYNVERYLTRCIESILLQKMKNFRLMLVDDGSFDGCSEYCDEFAKGDSRISIIHKSNGGLSDARNAGIEWAQLFDECNWLTFIDSDDWVLPYYLDELYVAATETNCKVSVCGYRKTNEEDVIYDSNIGHINIIGSEDFYCKGKLSFVVAWGKLYQKQLFNSIRYPVGMLHEDEFVTYIVLFEVNQIALVDNDLYCYFCNHEGITAIWTPKRLDSLIAFRNQISFFRKNGFEKAYKQGIFNAAMNIVKNYNQIKTSNNEPNKEKYYKKLRKELRHILHFSEAKKVLPFCEYKYIYEIAYPKLMKQFWILQSIKSKINKRKKHGNS